MMAFIHYTASHKATMARSSPLRIVGADSVMGSTVVDRHGQRVGELRDIMLDLSTGRIAYAVIALGFRSNADQLIVVPWNAVHPDHDAQRLRINAHADWIERAPSVQPGHAPDRFIQDWGAFIHNYFGTRPYWEQASATQYS
jgi:sporulation protein YlmC with PRC-barrel domain